MRTIFFLLQKEFNQIFKDPAILRLMFVMPIFQLLLLPMAANYEVKNVELVVVDHDHSSYSTQMISKIASSGYFKLVGTHQSYDSALESIAKDEADIILEIPSGFEKQLIRENESLVSISANAVNGARANLGSAYLMANIREFNQEIRMKWLQMPKISPFPLVTSTFSYWYNPNLDYKQFMVPGILVILLTMIGANLTALNIVKEKEIGTIEQINVTPIKKYEFILAKLIPFWIMGQIVMTFGLIIARLIYGIIPEGSLFTIYVFSSVYLLAVLGMGLLISTYSNTQQQAMLISFFIMMIFILMGGLYTPIESMPPWAQWITKFNPVSHFIQVMRMVVMKGSGIGDIKHQLGVISIMAVVFNTWAVINYKKRS